MAKFRARARTVDMLGRQQIAGIPTAISELFKNAHDAYAENVEVDYLRNEDLFVLRDDGIGMTEEEFVDRWLAIGTESKLGVLRDLPPPPKPTEMDERPMLGEKGIGRLAIAAIGPQVLILTRAKRGKRIHDTVMSFINWGLFEIPGVNLDDIDIPVIAYSQGDLPSKEDVLASVELFGENVEKLRKTLKKPTTEEPRAKLKSKVNPLALEHYLTRITSDLARFNVDPQALDKFLTKISSPSLTGTGHGTHFLILPTRRSLVLDIEGDITSTLIGFSNTMARGRPPRIRTSFRDHNTPETFVDLINPANFFTHEEFKTADHHFEGEFNEFGQFTGRVTIYEKKPVKHEVSWGGNKPPRTECGPFRLNLAYVQGAARESLIPRDVYARITQKLEKLGGLYIYKDGIRILPYGRSDYDFLELEQKRTRGAAYYYFSYRRMFGYVEITGKTNANLTEKAGREGFIQNTAYRQFRAILKNFFEQIARDFFRAGGEYTGIYEGKRTELRRQEAVRKEREKAAKDERNKFAATLDELFEKVQSEAPEKEVAQIIDTASQEIKATSDLEDSLKASGVLFEIETTAHSLIDDVRKRYKLTRPRGLGLTTKLRKEWEAWTKEADRLERELFEPANQQLQQMLNAAAEHERLSKTDLLKRVTTSLNSRIAEARTAVETEKSETTRAAEDVRKRALQITTESVHRLSELIASIKTGLGNIKQSMTKDAAILGEYYKLEATLSDGAEKERLALENLRLRLLQSLNGQINSEDVIEALEEENLALREESDSEIELAQLGMAVTLINHEFESTVVSIRNNLRRLQAWAELDKDLRNLYRHVRQDFDHLEAYLQLFTPLERRLDRRKILIRGSEIAKYLRDLFADRLRREKVEILSTNMFSQMVIKAYPSTFYPVFVNLVDNSLFWLRDSKEPRIIKLDIMGGSTWVISDTGPGVSARDRELIFERGFTRKPGGRGLGLKISRDLLSREGFDLLLADSKPGQGATFLIKPKPLNRRDNE
jgi:signal transduction histidine kinase